LKFTHQESIKATFMALALATFHIALLAIAASIFLAAAVSDACSYRIPNYLCGLLLILFPIFILTAPPDFQWHQNVGVFALVALSGFAMFLGNLAGAGDIKLLAVASLWAGPHFIAVLLVVTALAGGLVSIFMAIRTHIRQNKADDHVALSKVPIPYGIAIATGGLTSLAMMAQPILLPN
jgi:prepilin peptidase CpaA